MIVGLDFGLLLSISSCAVTPKEGQSLDSSNILISVCLAFYNHLHYVQSVFTWLVDSLLFVIGDYCYLG